MTKIVIVNDKDEVVGVKERSEITSSDIYRVSALWVVNSKGDILLAQRSFNKRNNPGKWGPAVAGTVEDGENYDINIYKEAEEELGIVNITFTKLQKLNNSEDGKRKYFGQWYYVVLDKPEEFFKKQDDEVEAIQWFSQSDLDRELSNNPEKFLHNLKIYVDLFRDLK